MALPVLTSNSPVAGSIAWTATTLVYDGVSYTIAAGSTANKYVWWRFSDKTVQVANSLPAIGPDDFLLFLNKGGVGAIVGTTQVVDGSLIVSGSILADAIGANQINSGHIQANAITATMIAANAVQADDIAAGAVTASKLSIGSVGDNSVKNGSFEDDTQGWGVVSSGAGAVADIVTGVSSSGAKALRLVRGTAANLLVGQDQASFIPVTSVAGRSWYVGCRAGAGSALASGFSLRAYWFQADKVTAASPAYTDVAANKPLGTSWAVFEGSVTPPSNARYMQVVMVNALSGSTMYVDEVMANEVIVAAQIGDGQITAAKIAANAVTAGSIAAGAIDGQTITGALIRTAASGQRMETASNRIRFFSPNGADAGSIQGNDNGASLGVIALATGTGQVRVGHENLPYGGSVEVSIPYNAYIDEVHTRAVVDYASGNPFTAPIGGVIEFAGSSAPGGWLICDGTAVSRTTYSDLFGVIGTTYGAGDGSTTFNLPNLKGRIPVGKDSGQTEFDTIGETGGEKAHAILPSELPGAVLMDTGVVSSAGGWHTNNDATYRAAPQSSIGSANVAHNNLQPYIVMNYIIKT